MIPEPADWGPNQIAEQEAKVDVCRFDLPEHAVRQEEEEGWYEKDRRLMVSCHKGMRVKFRKGEPRGPGTEGSRGDIAGLVEDTYRMSRFRDKYEERYARECEEEY